jgi:3-hydroxyisobutyrate dehydrogenase-like beta-hydroxyacid dehydrogenase
MKRIGFVGAGRMGGPMVRRLLDASYSVRAVGRSPASRQGLTGYGAEAVGTVAEAGDGADAVLVCVRTDEEVREVCLGSGLFDAMTAGSVLTVHTTASPRTVEAVADGAAAYGIAVVDAPVSGGPHEIAIGRLTLFVGGSGHAVSRIRDVLESYGDPVLHVGPLGAGQRVKLINNALFAAHIGLLAEAVRVGERMGVAEEDLLRALPHASAASRALSGARGRGSVAAFATAVAEFLGKDVDVVHAVAADLGCDLGAIDPAIAALAQVLPASLTAPSR